MLNRSRVIPVLTVNAADNRLLDEFRGLIKKLQAPIYISEVAGFGSPELSVSEGYLRGREKIKSFIEYFVEHGHYKPFLDSIN